LIDGDKYGEEVAIVSFIMMQNPVL